MRNKFKNYFFPSLNDFIFFRIILIIFIGTSCLPHYLSAAQADDTTRVLLLNSYHQGYEWTDKIVQSIRSNLKDPNLDIQLFIEYMDAKHYHSQKYLTLLKKLYEFKYHNLPFNLIIISDNYALDFIKKYRLSLFPKVPVVFCGINDFKKSMLAGYSNITGVVENYDLTATINLALRLNPNTKNIAVVSDAFPAGKSYLERFREIAPEFKNKYHIIEIANWTKKELQEKLVHLPEETIVLRLSFEVARDRQSFSNAEREIFWKKYCRFPTFVSMGRGVEHGAIGGIVITPELQGETVVRIAKKILHGESADDIPIVLKSPNIPIFDYYQLKKFGIKESSLPRGSVIINKPFSFYQTYKILVWSVVLVFLLLSTLLVILSINIVSRQQAEKALKENEEKYRILLETIPHGILEIDLLGRVNFGNTALKKMLGYSQDELLDMKVYDFVPSEDRDNAKTVLNILVEKKHQSNQVIGKYLTKDDRLIDVQLDWNYKRDVNGEINGIISVVSDISKRVQAEREAKIRHEQLIQADKMVALGTLISGVAHEINNPNNFIMINISILERAWKSVIPALDEYYGENGGFNVAGMPYKQMKTEFHEICADIMEGSKRINSIVSDLKKYSGKNENTLLEQVDINEIVSSCIHLLGSNINKFTDHFSVQYGENIPAIQGNFQHFEQIIINLIQNACQALPDRTKGVFVSTGFNKKEQVVEIEISDEGCGIAPVNLARIFDPFYTTKREQGGTGLGLCVSNSIIQKYKGSLHFTSKPNQGTKAKIVFPTDDQKKKENT
ncbi:MAG: PAS domain S-box protein [Actinobacteria bacterium]|nr:PAS domain S-box protein [Actinomycetota bacterium]